MTVYPGIGGLHGQHWNAFAQAPGYPAQQSNFGALGTQADAAQLAQLRARAQQAMQAAFQNALAQPARPIEDAGISVGEIIGHRAWNCFDYLLSSMAVGAVWPPDEPMHGDVKTAGVHAFKTQRDALSEYGLMGCRAKPVVIGTVALWGEVIEHEHGYRAEFGKVLSVDLVCGLNPWREGRLLRRIRERYRLEAAA